MASSLLALLRQLRPAWSTIKPGSLALERPLGSRNPSFNALLPLSAVCCQLPIGALGDLSRWWTPAVKLRSPQRATGDIKGTPIERLDAVGWRYRVSLSTRPPEGKRSGGGVLDGSGESSQDRAVDKGKAGNGGARFSMSMGGFANCPFARGAVLLSAGDHPIVLGFIFLADCYLPTNKALCCLRLPWRTGRRALRVRRHSIAEGLHSTTALRM